MSEQRSMPHGAIRRTTTLAPFQRIYLATLRRRLFAGTCSRQRVPAPSAMPSPRLALKQRQRYR
jgi:hypothetical protein